MFSLIQKEITGFLATLTGYIVIAVYLVLNSLFLWVFPGQFNIFDRGYASIDSLFIISPWVFLFLVPAITMRMISEERKTGTIELLITKPLSELQIIFAKYIAGMVLILIAIAPTLIYFITVYIMGNPVGNIDLGGTWGSYFGLIFLAGIYAAIGMFASAITPNQIIAFIAAMIISFLFYIGFESIANIITNSTIAGFFISLGINDHYKSMSRGVIDVKDVVYFISVIGIFLFCSKTALENR